MDPQDDWKQGIKNYLIINDSRFFLSLERNQEKHFDFENSTEKNQMQFYQHSLQSFVIHFKYQENIEYGSLITIKAPSRKLMMVIVWEKCVGVTLILLPGHYPVMQWCSAKLHTGNRSGNQQYTDSIKVFNYIFWKGKKWQFAIIKENCRTI